MFVKGKSGNPKGRPKATPENKSLRALTAFRFNEIVQKYLHSNIEDLKVIMKDKKTPALDMMLLSAILTAIRAGDLKTLNLILDRIIGKPRDVVDITHYNKTDLSKLSLEELNKLRELTAKAQNE